MANTPEGRRRVRGLLRFARRDARLTGMPVLALLYPSPTLAGLGDPLAIARHLGGRERPVPRGQLMEVVRRGIAEALAPLVADAPTEGSEDDSWYWAAPLVLDHAVDSGWNRAWWQAADLASAWQGDDDDVSEDAASGDARGAWRQHVTEARRVASGDLSGLGRPPDDLIEVLAELAVAGPGIAALRALGRLIGGPGGLTSADLRRRAASVAWGLRSLFNVPELTTFLRGSGGSEVGDEAYWRLVLRYCVDGNLQAVLDEYAHVLPESLGVAGHPREKLMARVAGEMRDALTLRAASNKTEELRVRRGAVTSREHRLRGRFALRFGDERTEEERSTQRQTQVRMAFNSPFWPFVLATTSIGQEGLDFHQYCHAVVHWNLPGNPVDLEQREGRVHRYKGHAVRKNVALKHREAAFGGADDPWAALFQAAVDGRQGEGGDLAPFWVFPIEGGASIERHVPALPLSRDQQRLEDLRGSLAAYRLAFGQPRQEDLVAYLQGRFSAEEMQVLFDELRIDLSPDSERRSA